jgi:hypothetical protein
LNPSTRNKPSVEALRKLTNGAANLASQFIGRATNIAMPSGLLRPKRFGTSSPNTSEKYVMMTTTIAKATLSA